MRRHPPVRVFLLADSVGAVRNWVLALSAYTRQCPCTCFELAVGWWWGCRSLFGGTTIQRMRFPPVGGVAETSDSVVHVMRREEGSCPETCARTDWHSDITTDRRSGGHGLEDEMCSLAGRAKQRLWLPGWIAVRG